MSGYYGYEDEDDEYTPFYRTEALKIGHPIYDPEKIWDFVNQTKVWRDKAQVDIKIKSMEKQYVFNVLKWADKNAQQISFTLSMAHEIGKADGLVDPFAILEFPLFVRMRERYLKLVK